MDGVRGYWNGEKMFSRRGKLIDCPLSFVAGLPQHLTLDGELWAGPHTTFTNLIKIINSNNSNNPPNWNQIGYYVFDIPSSPGTYEERMAEMERLLPAHNMVHIVKNIECRGKEHLQMFLQEIVTGGGEGIMLRRPLSHWEPGYTSSLLKVKVFEELICFPQLFSNLKTQKLRY